MILMKQSLSAGTSRAKRQHWSSRVKGR